MIQIIAETFLILCYCGLVGILSYQFINITGSHEHPWKNTRRHFAVVALLFTCWCVALITVAAKASDATFWPSMPNPQMLVSVVVIIMLVCGFLGLRRANTRNSRILLMRSCTMGR